MTSAARSGGDAVLGYALATLLGAVLVASLFPAAALDGTLTLTHPVVGDPAQHIVGQRYFLAAGWGWPPLVTRLIDPPGGVNIALTDSIPLLALLARPFAALLPRGGHLVYAWVALGYLLQPAAAVFAVRSAGVGGLAGPLAGGVMAVCMPAFLFRHGHAALSAHFVVLLAVGLYFRLVRAPASRWWLPATALMVAALLIHPYLMAMVVAILAAAPVSLLVRRETGAAVSSLRLLGGVGVLACVAALGGYFGAGTAPGFGYYSLNLLSPFVPAGSDIIGGFVVPDATGGQFEGYSYLGLGLMALAVAAVLQLGRPAVRAWLRGHAGLLAVAAGAAVFALSDTVYAGQRLLFHLPLSPGFLRQFRASGRFVWVDLYVLLVLAVVLTWLGLGARRAAAVLVAAAALQFADTRGLRSVVSGAFDRATEWAVDPQLYRPLFASHRLLTLWPTAACDDQLVNDPVFMHLLLLSSEVALPVNTIPTARNAGFAGCDPSVLTRPALLPGELRLLLPGTSPNLVVALPGLRGHCHGLPGGLTACTASRSLDDRPVAAMAAFPLDQTVSLGQPGGAALRGLGWTDPTGDGAWSIGAQATLFGSVPPAAGALRLSVTAHGLAAGGQAQTVRVGANGQPVAVWQVAQGADATYRADLPPGVTADGNLAITLDIAAPARPSDVLGTGDIRPLGLFLRDLRLATP